MTAPERQPGPDLTVCILSWNTRALLRRCLASLYHPQEAEVQAALARAGFVERALVAGAAPASPSRGDPRPSTNDPRPTTNDQRPTTTEILVVDNASGDGSADMVEAEFPMARLHRSPENLGFPGGNNVGYRLSHGRYFLLLNSDTVVAPGAFAELVAFADDRPRVGIVGPRVLNPDGSLQMSCRRFPTLGAGLFRNTPLGRLFPNNRYTRDYLMTDWSHDEPRAVDWVSGCCLMARRAMIEEIGLLDEGFFMYCEDVDWAYRAGQAGWEVYYDPRATIVHEIGRSTDQAVTRMIVQFHKSMYRFFCKHYAATANPVFRAVVVGGLLARAGLMLGRNRALRARIQWRELRDRLERR
jgi:GT2 family glycosyltransferase